MASEDNLLNKLVALVSGFDDASWEALASKGLLRRARKDIERLEVEIVDGGGESLQIKVPPFMVSMPASGPAKATCSCPAPGVCQHILIAGLFLQSRLSPDNQRKERATEEAIRREVSSLTPDTLKSWVGTTDYRKGLALFEKNSLPPMIEYEETVVIRLSPSNIEVRFVPGSGLDGMLLPKLNGKRAGVAAVLALRKSLGLEIPEGAAQQLLVELSGTPRSKKEILDSACAVLEDAVAVGLSHVSQILAERLVTLAVSAQGAYLPRVSLALKTVADEVRSILRREARADEDRLLTLIARVYALLDAIRSGSEQAKLELAGSSRGLYVEVPEMDLAGVGAYTWQTGSGYVGLTVLFWANLSKEFLSWSYARPEMQRIDARQRFYGEGPWEGTQSPQQVATSTLKLRNGGRTAQGRLSSSTKTTALVLGTTDPEGLDFAERAFTSWTRLRGYVATKQPLGLREPNPLEMIVVLQPTYFGNRSFDPISQTFFWETYDLTNEVLTLSLPFRDWNQQSIRTLEELSPAEGSRWRFVVRLTYQDDELLVEPISILRSEVKSSPVFQLAFDSSGNEETKTVADKGGQVAVASAADESDLDDIHFDDRETSDVGEVFVPSKVALGRVLTEVNSRLLAIAETGAQKGLAMHRQWFLHSTKELHALGLTTLARSLSSLAQKNSSAAVVLRTRYLTHLHTQATAHLFN
jgi:hypothetical protein